MAFGRVIKFDQVKGYGFIAPKSGDADIFLHVNDLLDDKNLIKPGTSVTFHVEEGDRGLKASAVHIVEERPAPAVQPVRNSGYSVTLDQAGELPDDLCEIISSEKYVQEITEVLLAINPPLTGRQILLARGEIAKIGKKYGWVED